MNAQGEEVRPFDEAGARAALTQLKDKGVEAITGQLHERLHQWRA